MMKTFSIKDDRFFGRTPFTHKMRRSDLVQVKNSGRFDSSIYGGIMGLLRKSADAEGFILLTDNQVKMLRRGGVMSAIKKLEIPIEPPPRTSQSKKHRVVVVFKDEDGQHEAPFESLDKAKSWVRFRQSGNSTGEKFEFIEFKYK